MKFVRSIEGLSSDWGVTASLSMFADVDKKLFKSIDARCQALLDKLALFDTKQKTLQPQLRLMMINSMHCGAGLLDFDINTI